MPENKTGRLPATLQNSQNQSTTRGAGLQALLANEPGLPADDLAAIRSQVEAGRLEPPTPTRPLMPWESVGRFLDTDPGPVDWLFRDMIPAGVVSALVAKGGSGKSFLLIQIAAAAATGEPFGPFIPGKPRRVLLLAGEDPTDVLHRRIRAAAVGMKLAGPGVAGTGVEPVLRANFAAVSLVGEDRVLIGRDPAGNPATSPTFAWLSESLGAMAAAGKPVDLLLVDPMARFFGLDENDNGHATAFIACLEELAKKHALTVLFAHHVAKGAGKDGSDLTGRGASAIGDGCRFVMSLSDLKDADIRQFGIDQADRYAYVCLQTPKVNHAARAGKDLYFRRGRHGILEPVELDTGIRLRQADALADILAEDGPIPERALLKGEGKDAKTIRKALRDAFPRLSMALELPLVVTVGVEAGKIVRTEEPAANGKVSTVLRNPCIEAKKTAGNNGKQPVEPKGTTGSNGKKNLPAEESCVEAEKMAAGRNHGKNADPAEIFPAVFSCADAGLRAKKPQRENSTPTGGEKPSRCFSTPPSGLGSGDPARRSNDA
ncbi:MAG: AAA family ATPase [Candidatus Riflebacteria bacterium]|nr:AAA family ATPase [Candidatus Riflebacteria bacterium]